MDGWGSGTDLQTLSWKARCRSDKRWNSVCLPGIYPWNSGRMLKYVHLVLQCTGNFPVLITVIFIKLFLSCLYDRCSESSSKFCLVLFFFFPFWQRNRVMFSFLQSCSCSILDGLQMNVFHFYFSSTALTHLWADQKSNDQTIHIVTTLPKLAKC